MDEQEVQQLKEKLVKMEQLLKDEQVKAQQARREADILETSMHHEPLPSSPVYVTTSQKLERFRDKPVKSSDPEVEEWIQDVQSQIDLRKIDTRAQAVFILDHLAGSARQEILGRGKPTTDDPMKMFSVLRMVFGAGEELSTLKQKFYTYRQKDTESLLDCSLELLKIYNRMCQLDSSLVAGKTEALKSYLADAVSDVNLKREIRRLNRWSPDLDFFDMRDCAIQWMGTPSTTATASNVKSARTTVTEEISQDSAVLELLKKQGAQIEAQQKQIGDILSRMDVRRKFSENNRQDHSSNQQYNKFTQMRVRACWRCGSTEHLKNKCPHPPKLRSGNEESTVPKTVSTDKHF